MINNNCKICNHPDKTIIDDLLKDKNIKEKDIKLIAQQYGFSETAIHVHKNMHLMKKQKTIVDDKPIESVTIDFPNSSPETPNSSLETHNSSPETPNSSLKILTDKLKKVEDMIQDIEVNEKIEPAKKNDLILRAMGEVRKIAQDIAKIEVELQASKEDVRLDKLIIHVVDSKIDPDNPDIEYPLEIKDNINRDND